MTTIRIAHKTAGYYLELTGVKMEESISKEHLTIPQRFTKSKWGTPTQTSTFSKYRDSLVTTRNFTITGYLDADCLKTSGWGTPTGDLSAPRSRDALVNMLRYGGSVHLYYGIYSEKGVYTSSANDMYYTLNAGTEPGFSCFITRIHLTEEPEDSSTIPTKYLVIITVAYGFINGQTYWDGSKYALRYDY